MCEFISWKIYNNKIYFLTDDIIAPNLEEFKKDNPNWKNDLPGHGAIEWFFNLPIRCWINMECTDFSFPSNFPEEIIQALISGKITYPSFPKGLLRETLKDEYYATIRALNDDYYAKYHSLNSDYTAMIRALNYDYYTKLKSLNEKQWKLLWKLFMNPSNRSEAWKLGE